MRRLAFVFPHSGLQYLKRGSLSTRFRAVDDERLGTVGASPRVTTLSNRIWTAAAFLRSPRQSPSSCRAASIPAARRSRSMLACTYANASSTARSGEPARCDLVMALQYVLNQRPSLLGLTRALLNFVKRSLATWRNARRTETCTAGIDAMMFRALWIWQRWIGGWRPKLWRSAFAPSMINKRGTAGSRPRSIRSLARKLP